METRWARLALCEGNPPVNDGYPSQRINNVALYCFISYELEKAVKQTTDLSVLCDAISALALWRTATGDAVLARSIENRCIKNSEGPATQHANLGTKQVISLCSHSLLSVAGILQFPFVRYFTRIPWIFRSVSVSVAGNQMALGSVLSCVLRHTIMTSPTCALTQLFVPDNHRQGCQRRHLKLNTCVRHNFKHTNFKLFLAILIK